EPRTVQEVGEFLAGQHVGVVGDADRAARSQYAVPHRDGGGQQVVGAAGKRVVLSTAAVLHTVRCVRDDQVHGFGAQELIGTQCVGVVVVESARVARLVGLLGGAVLDFEALPQPHLVASQHTGLCRVLDAL